MSNFISRACERLARNRPCRVLKAEGRPYLERYYLSEIFGVRAYLHRFVDGDYSEALHHHPWSWSGSLILSGSYKEERIDSPVLHNGFVAESVLSFTTRTLTTGSLNAISAKTLHRIVDPAPGTWTLFIHVSRKTQKWGQLVPAGPGLLKIKELGSLDESTWENTCPLGKDHPEREPFLSDQKLNRD
jgi:hypothetical protein